MLSTTVLLQAVRIFMAIHHLSHLQFYASLKKHFKGKHLCHHKEMKTKVHWWVQTLSLVSYPWKLNVGECLNNEEIWYGWGMWHVWETREVHTGFWWGDLSERDHLEDLGVDEDSIKMDIQDVGWECMDWIDLAEDRDRRRALVNAVMNLLVP